MPLNNNRRNNRAGMFTQGGVPPISRRVINTNTEEVPLVRNEALEEMTTAISEPEPQVENPVQEENFWLDESVTVERAEEAMRETRATSPRPSITFTGNPFIRTTEASNPYAIKEKEAPKLDMNSEVKTVTGKKHLVSDCIFYDGDWFHKEHKEVYKDCIAGDFIHRHTAYEVNTEIIFPKKGEKLVFTKGFTKYCNKDKVIPLWSKKYGVDSSITSLEGIKNWEYKESYECGCYVDKDHPEVSISDIRKYDQFKNPFRDVTDKKILTELGQISPSYSITEGLRYTFGVELEMSRGYLPYWKAKTGYLNVSCVRDGSLNTEEGSNGGPEIVTGILTGDTGLKQLQKACLELSKRTKVNSSCGMHIHLGNLDFSKKFLVNSYILALLLEDEIASTLPHSRRKNQYCKKLTSFNFKVCIGNDTEDIMRLEQDYNRLFSYISVEKTNNPNFDYNKSKQHPLGAKCGYQHSTPRYCWLNYVPAMFNTRNNGSYSLELRNHSGTTNFTKVKNWLLLFMAFCAFVERHPELIKKGITINDIIEKIFPKKAKSLIMYFNSRKELFDDKENDSEYQETVAEEKTIKELINN